jgi:hypothetical protein
MGNIYKYLFGQELANAHNSLVDAKAQTKIILHKTFLPFMNEQYSIKLLDDVWNRKVQAQAKVASEPTRPVPEPWKADDKMEMWNLPPQFQYNGPPPGAKSKVKTAIRGKDDFEALKELWLLIYNREIMQFVAKETMRYAYDDWVLPTDRPNRDGNASKRKYWKHVPAYVDGARHRIDESIVSKDKRWDVTVGFLTAWHGLLLYSGAKRKRKISTMWANLPYGDHDPIAMNTMTWDAFLFIRRTIHFCNNSELKPRGDPGYSPIHKVSKVSNVIMQGLRQCWNPGGKLTIDEQMIK